ncbi:hypothetical protein YC2023_036493 [Brassica napus]
MKQQGANQASITLCSVMDEASPAVAVAFRRSSRNGDVVVLQRRLWVATWQSSRRNDLDEAHELDLGTSSSLLFPLARKDCNDMISDRKSQSWRYCLSGQMSNHSIYLEKHMIFAALLDRVLEIPSSRFDYENDRVTDIDRINTCLGRSVVVSFDQCKEMDKKKKRGILSQSPHQHEASSVSLLIQQQLCGFVRSYEVSVLILSVASTTASVSHLLSYAPSSRPDHGNDHLNLQGSFLLFIPNDLPWR